MNDHDDTLCAIVTDQANELQRVRTAAANPLSRLVVGLHGLVAIVHLEDQVRVGRGRRLLDKCGLHDRGRDLWLDVWLDDRQGHACSKESLVWRFGAQRRSIRAVFGRK